MSRPRGFATYRPQGNALELIEATRTVLAEYADHLPLTLRQIYYRLVAGGTLEKTECAYKRLGEILNRARRAELIDFAAMRDDGLTCSGGDGFANRQDVREYLHRLAAGLCLDRQAGQDVRLQIWCETGGMVPQLARVAGPYGVAVVSSGGFDSVTAKHEAGLRLAGEPTAVLHIGDHDPSGVHIFSSLAEDVGAFAAAYGAGGLEFVRLAVTPEQARRLDLPSAPPKVTDRRKFDGNRTWQCEALAPDVLADILRDAIARRMDVHAYTARLHEEAELREELAEAVSGWLA